MQIAILGAGAWGTALAIEFSHAHQVKLWARDAAQAQQMSENRENTRYLSGVILPPTLQVTADFLLTIDSAELILLVTPIAGLRPNLRALSRLKKTLPTIIWACKGFEMASGLLPHQISAEELPKHATVGVLAGPSFAREVANGLPTAVTIASTQIGLAENIAKTFNSQRLRLYANNDLIGVEVGAAVKNVMAIASGVADGLGFGLNTRAALITRGLAEISRLSLALGGKTSTMMGLSGMGDLILTCTGDLSRNRQVGLKLSKGLPLKQILNELGHVAEGVTTAYEVKRMAQKHAVSMPITDAVCRLLDGGVDVVEVVKELMSREPKLESN